MDGLHFLEPFPEGPIEKGVTVIKAQGDEAWMRFSASEAMKEGCSLEIITGWKKNSF